MLFLLSFIKQLFQKKAESRLSRINTIEFFENGRVRKKAGPNFFRQFRKFNTCEAILREIEILKKIEYTQISPKILAVEEDAFIMEKVGEPICKNNLPQDWREQIDNIHKTLQKYKIIHRDIKRQNLMVMAGKIYLIDYGWSLIEGNGFFLCPQDLCKEIPKELIYDNLLALNHTVQTL